MTDGVSALHTVLLECLNLAGDGTTYLRLGYMQDNLQADAVEMEHTNADGEPLGSSTFTGHTKGTITYKLDKASYKTPQPGFTLKLNRGDGKGDIYLKCGQAGPTYQRNNVVQGSMAVTKVVNPIILTLLSEALGQHKAVSIAAVSGAYSLTCEAVNVRSGATKAWSLENAPSGMSINSSTGEITWATPVAGSYEVTVKVTDTLSGSPTLTGFAKLFLTVT